MLVAAERVRAYHEKQKQDSWSYTEADGTMLGQKVTPMDRVGIYVPGGKAALPVVGADERHSGPRRRCAGNHHGGTERPGGELNQLVLAAAAAAGVSRVFTVGGAQAVAALAYGTATVPQVDKIVGPGKYLCGYRKRAVFGQVGIDMIAGPSEILVVCDGKTDPDWIAMDLFSPRPSTTKMRNPFWSAPTPPSWMPSKPPSTNCCRPWSAPTLSAPSLSERGALIHAQNDADAIAIINRIAPEHLELSIENPQAWLPQIRHAGAIFYGSLHRRGSGRLLCWSQSRIADLRHRAILIAAGGVRFPEAFIADYVFGRWCVGTGQGGLRYWRVVSS